MYCSSTAPSSQRVDRLADVLAGDLEEAAAPADGAVASDLAGLAVEKHVLDGDEVGVIELDVGSTRICVRGRVESEALARVLDALEGRR